jgi:hypothetical protein
MMMTNDRDDSGDPYMMPAMVGAVTVLEQSLISTLLVLAQSHDGQPGQWLDDLEALFKRAAKGAVSNMSMESELEAVEAGLAALTSVFNAVRSQLSGQPPGAIG